MQALTRTHMQKERMWSVTANRIRTTDLTLEINVRNHKRQKDKLERPSIDLPVY